MKNEYYQRILTYLYLQKLKCPNCNRVLGGKATTKKNGKPYYYYYFHDCKIEFKENLINEYFNQFIDELVQYDSVVNQFFLPMIRQKFDEPKEELQKEINEQKAKLDRIKKAYVNGVFKLQEEKESLKVQLQKFKGFGHSLMCHFQKRITYGNDQNYKIVSDDLYKNGIFDDNDNEIANNILRKVTIPNENKAEKNRKKNNDTRF